MDKAWSRVGRVIWLKYYWRVSEIPFDEIGLRQSSVVASLMGCVFSVLWKGLSHFLNLLLYPQSKKKTTFFFETLLYKVAWEQDTAQPGHVLVSFFIGKRRELKKQFCNSYLHSCEQCTTKNMPKAIFCCSFAFLLGRIREISHSCLGAKCEARVSRCLAEKWGKQLAWLLKEIQLPAPPKLTLYCILSAKYDTRHIWERDKKKERAHCSVILDC